MKKLCRFYCVDCDNAWIELFLENGDNHIYVDKCDYCGKTQPAEEIDENQKD